jgi:perosamine synthetase
MIPHNKPTLGRREIEAAERVINSGWVAQGKEVASFEDEISKFLGLDHGHVVVVSSGTAALFMSLWALESKGCRVGVPVYSCTALKNSVEMAGASPVYLDCASRSPNIDIGAVQLPDIDVLIAPSIFGIPIGIGNTHGCKVVEDIAQAFGAEENGKLIGIRGEIGICSFYATKLITSGGQGGAVFSRDKKLIDGIRDYREFDNRRDQKNRFNFQMTDIQAAIGREQLQQFSEFKEARDFIFSLYNSAGLDLLSADDSVYKPVRYRAVLRTPNPTKVIRELKKNKIKSIVPIDKSELLGGSADFNNAKALSESTVSLPIYPGLDLSVINRVVSCIHKVDG